MLISLLLDRIANISMEAPTTTTKVKKVILLEN